MRCSATWASCTTGRAGWTRRAHYDAALAVHRDVGNRGSEGAVLGNLGILRRAQGRMGEARAFYDAALALAREIGARYSEGVVLGNLATCTSPPLSTRAGDRPNVQSNSVMRAF